MATTNIKTMKELVDTTAAPTGNNLQTFYPKTHEKAVVDDNGNTLDSKLAAIIEDVQESIDSAKEETLEENRQIVNSIMENYAPVEITGDVNNAADEEDLTSVNIEGTDVLKFKDKVYNSLVYSGLGRKILRKNIVEGVNTLTQDMFYKGEVGSRVPNDNTIYVIQYDFVLGEDITIPENSMLEFDGGSISASGSNDTITGQNTCINAPNVQIFSQILLNGTFTNADIVVEWFGCSIENSGQANNDALRKYIIPSAISTKMNVYHSNQGIYKIAGNYGGLSRYIGDGSSHTIDDYDNIFCNGIKIYGTGVNTIIKGIVYKAPSNPGDVFNLAKVHDIIISDLAITAESTEDTSGAGTNAISIVLSGENITIERINVYDMVYTPHSYPDGGKAFTIQSTAKGSVKNVVVRDCIANNVAFGVDLTKSYTDGDIITGVMFINNIIRDAVAGCFLSIGGKLQADKCKSVTVSNNSFIDCQYGIYSNGLSNVLIYGNYISNTKEYTKYKYYGNYVDGIRLIAPYSIFIGNNYINMPYCNNLLSVIPLSSYSQYVDYIPEKTSIIGNQLIGNPTDYGMNLGLTYDKYNVNEYFFKDNIVSNNKIVTIGRNDIVPWANKMKFIEKNFIANNLDSFKNNVDNYVPTKHSINILDCIEKPSYFFNNQNVHAVDNGECQYEGNGIWQFTISNMRNGGYVVKIAYEDFTSGKVQFRIDNSLDTNFIIGNIIESSKSQAGIAEGTFCLTENSNVTFKFEGINSSLGIIKKIEIFSSYHNGMLCGIQDVWLSGLPIHSNGNAINNVFKNYGKVYSDKTGNLKVRGSKLVDRYIDNISNMPTGFGIEDRGLEFFLHTSAIKKPIYNLGGTTWADANGNSALASRKGSMADAPIGGTSGTVNESRDIGFLYFETDNNRPIFVKSINYGTGVVTWVDAMGVDISLNKSGTFAQRPTRNVPVGFKYWATDKGAAGVGMYIYYTGDNNTPWVDATGQTV